MAKDQPGIVGIVVAFAVRAKPATYLTPRDRMDLCAWREAVYAAGYEKINIHEREDGDDSDFGDFLCLHRRNEAWSRWGFARKGALVTVWCCLTGADIGEFPTMAAALEAVLPAKPPRPQPHLAVVTDLSARLRQAGNRLGSAA